MVTSCIDIVCLRFHIFQPLMRLKTLQEKQLAIADLNFYSLIFVGGTVGEQWLRVS